MVHRGMHEWLSSPELAFFRFVDFEVAFRLVSLCRDTTNRIYKAHIMLEHRNR
jgi:hypothetical protein